MPAILTEMPDNPRTWDSNESIETYLSKRNINCDKAISLQGGCSGYIWRLDGYRNGRKTYDRCIFKYADTELKGKPDFKTEPGRTHNEVRTLSSEAVRWASEREPGVKVPSVLQTTDEGFVMTWAGEKDLKDAFINDKQLDSVALATRLGRWLAGLHLSSMGSEEAKVWTNDLMEKAVPYEAAILKTGFTERGIDADITERAVSMMQDPGPVQVLTSGDFRPMNTLLDYSTSTSNPIATVVDWECMQYACPSIDFRLWPAEMLVQEKKYPHTKGILAAFLKAYREEAGADFVTEDLVCKVAVKVGSIMFWVMPLHVWDVTEEEEGEEWRKVAIEYICAGAKGDVEWLRSSALGPLLGS